MKYITYLFYRYYNQGATIRIPYESAILAILLLLFINFASLMLLFDPAMTHALLKTDSRTQLYIYTSIGVAIVYFALSKMIPKKEITQIKASKNVKLHSWLLFAYIIISFLFLMLLIIRNRQ